MLDFYFKDIKPVSSNAMYNAFRGSINKSTKYKSFEKFISNSLTRKLSKIRSFEKQFSRSENALTCRVIIEIPEKYFFTKDGFIPKRKNDIDNFNKTLIDSVFKSFQMLDDAYILELISVKKLSQDENYNARLQLETIDLD